MVEPQSFILIRYILRSAFLFFGALLSEVFKASDEGTAAAGVVNMCVVLSHVWPVAARNRSATGYVGKLEVMQGGE